MAVGYSRATASLAPISSPQLDRGLSSQHDYWHRRSLRVARAVGGRGRVEDSGSAAAGHRHRRRRREVHPPYGRFSPRPPHSIGVAFHHPIAPIAIAPTRPPIPPPEEHKMRFISSSLTIIYWMRVFSCSKKLVLDIGISVMWMASIGRIASSHCFSCVFLLRQQFVGIS